MEGNANKLNFSNIFRFTSGNTNQSKLGDRALALFLTKTNEVSFVIENKDNKNWKIKSISLEKGQNYDFVLKVDNLN
jgi:hypothetical protein